MPDKELAQLTRAAKQRAARAISNIHDAYHAKGGIRDKLDELKDEVTMVGEQIFSLAMFAEESAESSKHIGENFKALCAYSESWYKEHYEVSNLADALPHWRVYKSQIGKAIELGLRPKDYASEYELRKAREQLRLEGGDKLPVAQRRTLKAVEKILLPVPMPMAIRWLLSRTIFNVARIGHDDAEKAERILQRALDDIAKLKDK